MYVGQSIEFEKRMTFHKNSKQDDYIHRAIRKNGWDNFEKYKIDICYTNQSDLDQMEIHYMDVFNVKMENGHGYNIKDGGSKGHLSQETKNKISKANLGKIRSEQACKNIGDSHIGVKCSEETKKKISDAQLGEKNHMFGKTEELSHRYGTNLSNEAKKKISDANKGRIKTEEEIAKLRKSNPKIISIKYIESGEIFISIRCAARKMNLSHGSINFHLKGSTKHSHVSGFHFEKVIKNGQ